MIDLLAKAGGIFSLLVFFHFAVDWLFQSHDEAMAKSSNWRVRWRHCEIYTFPFIPVMWLLKLTYIEMAIGILVLFFSHFFEDTYYPVLLWVKHIRKPPHFNPKSHFNPVGHHMPDFNSKEADVERFKAFVSTPLGIILVIAVDQIIHISFLFVIVYMALN
jgi:hypothetical protein